MIDVSIIIPNFNTRKLLYNCLNSIYNETKSIKFEIIVIDNGSKDESAEMVRKHFPKATLIINKKNLGYAKANNQGIRAAKGEYTLLLNSDTKILNRAIEKMVDWMSGHPKVGVAGCQLKNPDGSVQPSAGFLPRLSKIFFWALFLDDLPFFWRLIKPYQIAKKSFYKKERLNLGWVTGAFFMARKKMVDDVGLFDSQAPTYVEEVEWCYRIRKKGWQIAFNPESKVIHRKGASSKIGFEAAILGENRGLQYFFNKHKPRWEMSILRLLLKTAAILRIFVFGVIMKDSKKREVYEKAFELV